MVVMKTNPKLFKPYVPKAPRFHGLFGTKFFKIHQFADKKWQPTDLTLQYKCVVGVLEKNLEFRKLEKQSKRRVQKAILKNLRLECRDGRTRLKAAMLGDVQSIRNILSDHKDLQRLYQNMPVHMINDSINQRTFLKRKERDRLKYRIRSLMKSYETKVIDKSNLENQIKYDNETLIKDDYDAKECRKQLSISRTRIKALSTITRGYKQMIQTLMQDAIYYEPVLDSLNNDINEQANFIEHVTMLGLPAIGKLKILLEEYTKCEENTRRKMGNNLKFLTDFKTKVFQDNEEVKLIVRKATEKVGVIRKYDRETTSMTDLRLEMEDIGKVIKQLQLTTLSSNAKQVYPRTEQALSKNEKLFKELVVNEKALNFTCFNENRAEIMRDSLKHNLTDEEIERMKTMKALTDEIAEQKKAQTDCDRKIVEFGEISTLLKFSLWNIIDVLRHVGKPFKPIKRKYPNEELKLPLLNFEAKPMMAYPPECYDDNVRTLVITAAERVKELMDAYKELPKERQLEAFEENYKSFMKSIAFDEEIGETEETGQPLFDLGDSRGDPNVLTRKQIKVISAKIVEMNMKRDDE